MTQMTGMTRRGNLFVISAPSGSGKTTLVRRLVDTLDDVGDLRGRQRRVVKLDSFDFPGLQAAAPQKGLGQVGMLSQRGVVDDGRPQVAARLQADSAGQPGVAKRSLVEECLAERGPFEVGFEEFGPAEIGAAEIGASERGPAEVGSAEVGPFEVGFVEPGAAEVGLAEAGLAEAGRVEVRLAERRAAEIGAVEPGMAKVGASEVGKAEVGPPKVGLYVRMLLPPPIPRFGASLQDVHMLGVGHGFLSMAVWGRNFRLN